MRWPPSTGLAARKAALEEWLSRVAREGEWWPTVARLRCFRGIERSRRSRSASRSATGRVSRAPPSSPAGSCSSPARPVRRRPPPGRDHEDRLGLCPPASGRSRLTRPAAPERRPALAERRAGQPEHVFQGGLRAQRPLHRLHPRLRARGKPGNAHRGRRRSPASSGLPPWLSNPHRQPPARVGAGPNAAGTRD